MGGTYDILISFRPKRPNYILSSMVVCIKFQELSSVNASVYRQDDHLQRMCAS